MPGVFAEGNNCLRESSCHGPRAAMSCRDGDIHAQTAAFYHTSQINSAPPLSTPPQQRNAQKGCKSPVKAGVQTQEPAVEKLLKLHPFGLFLLHKANILNIHSFS